MAKVIAAGRMEAAMAVMKPGFLSSLGLFEPQVFGDSEKARKFVNESFLRSGGRPTPEFEHIYGEYLKYKREKEAARKG